jgi:uncharacterized protein YjbJ (UPF0337 family)
MNADVRKGAWARLKGRIKQRWGRFTDDDAARIAGDRQVFLGELQELYGRTRAQAEAELEPWLAAPPEPGTR